MEDGEEVKFDYMSNEYDIVYNRLKLSPNSAIAKTNDPNTQ